MAKFIVQVRYGEVVKGVRVRSKLAYENANAAADKIADVMNTELIPEFYPGKVGRAIQAIADPSRKGSRLHRVRVRRRPGVKWHLWEWYEYGTKPHGIAARNAPNLVFWWERGGKLFVGPELPIGHPGWRGAHNKERMRSALRMVAHFYWTDAMAYAMKKNRPPWAD